MSDKSVPENVIEALKMAHGKRPSLPGALLDWEHKFGQIIGVMSSDEYKLYLDLIHTPEGYTITGQQENNVNHLTMVTDENEYEPGSSNPGEPLNESIIDIRGDYDEIAHVKDGILYRKGNIVQVWWDKWGKETWTGPSEEEARENFNAMKERWSPSEAGVET
ncbi:hypothetical protein KKF82_07935 [Patescibacteria group bacterium]|uniref:Uncharacterized protein n=1 Tax=viral metagenome TaxID=1070528 RepID=A0A6M3MEH3_9ZZZZ|nr:hypothetical protein [Patescibacteria group bacterium]